MNKEKLATIITDTHLNELNYKFIEELYDNFINYTIKQGVKIVIMNGDFFDYRKAQTIESLLTAKSIFDKFLNLKEKYNIKVIFNSGNHDKSTLDKPSFLEIFEKYVTLFDLNCGTIDYKDYNFVFLPYFEGDQLLNQLDKVKQIKNSDNKYKRSFLFAHLQIQDINVEIQSLFDNIYLGHIHEKEKITDRACYLGSGFQQNFSEDAEKGFSLLYSDGSLKLIKSHFKEYIVQIIDINAFTEKEIKEFIIKFKEANKERFIRIELVGSNKDTTSIKEFCKQNNINCLSKVQNSIQNTQIKADSISAVLSNNQIKEYYTEFESTQIENTNKFAKEIIKNLLWKKKIN